MTTETPETPESGGEDVKPTPTPTTRVTTRKRGRKKGIDPTDAPVLDDLAKMKVKRVKRRKHASMKSYATVGVVAALLAAGTVYEYNRSQTYIDAGYVSEQITGALGTYGFPAERGTQAAISYLTLALTQSDNVEVERELRERLSQESTLGEDPVTLDFNHDYRLLAPITPATALFEVSGSLAEQDFIAIVESDVTTIIGEGDYAREDVTTTVDTLRFRVRMGADYDTGSVYVIGGPALLPPLNNTAVAPSITSDATMSAELQNRTLRPFFTAWGKSDEATMRQFVASDATGGWTKGLTDMTLTSINVSAPSDALDGARFPVTVTWTTPEESTVKSTYLVEVAKEGAKVVVTDVG